MSNEDRTNISKYTLESIMTHFSIVIKRLTISLIIVALLWFLTITGFVVYLSLPDSYDSTTVENTDGNANYIGNDMNGDINNGEDKDR